MIRFLTKMLDVLNPCHDNLTLSPYFRNLWTDIELWPYNISWLSSLLMPTVKTYIYSKCTPSILFSKNKMFLKIFFPVPKPLNWLFRRRLCQKARKPPSALESWWSCSLQGFFTPEVHLWSLKRVIIYYKCHHLGENLSVS